jgi:predicted transcriptional regulator
VEKPRPLFWGADMDDVTRKTAPGWIKEALERGEAQIKAGQTVPLEPVLERLRDSIARMKSRRVNNPRP